MSRRGENIYKRKDNRWEARYIRGYTSNGMAQYGYCYAKTYREVKEKVTRKKAIFQKNRSNVNGDSHKKLSFYCDDWLHFKRDQVKESTYVKYSSIIENHIKPKLGDYFVQSLSTVQVETFTHKLIYEESLSPKSVKDILTVLQAIIKHIRRYSPDPFPIIEVIYPKENRKEMRVLTREEQSRFTNYLIADMDDCKFGILLALLTGLRIGEICALRWRDINLQEKVISVSSTMQRLKNLDEQSEKKTRIVTASPKSIKSARKIPLTDYMEELCKAYKPSEANAYVLTGKTEHYMEPRSLQYRVKQYAKECSLEDFHFHVLRHTFATRCIEVGFEVKSLSEILGHTSPRFTLERYVHSSMELKRINMKKLSIIEDSILSPSDLTVKMG